MLRLLLDEHISPKVALQLAARNPGLEAVSMQRWEAGAYLDADDDILLRHALDQQLTLVTYDQRTIVPELRLWSERGWPHGGVIFVDDHTIPQNDLGGLVRALERVWVAQRDLNWTDRVIYLTPPIRGEWR